MLMTPPDRSCAGVAELADALDLGSSDENRGGSNPPARTRCALMIDRIDALTKPDTRPGAGRMA
jgi:hypothetical protein